MTEKISKGLVRLFFLHRIQKTERRIGYKLIFHKIPPRYINGWVSWDMTKNFKKFRLDIVAGVDYWTMGKITHGVSSRYDRSAPEYQSWLGGYTVKLASKQSWTVEDHFKLAIADQNSWLKSYGDPNPVTKTQGWKFRPAGIIQSNGYQGTLYEGGCTTDSDVGNHDNTIKLRIEAAGMAAFFNLSNPKLHITGNELRPKTFSKRYETVQLHGYIAIFDIAEKVKVILYGNGALVGGKEGEIDTFNILKGDLRKAMESCEIIKIV